jgi:hypothetical protein
VSCCAGGACCSGWDSFWDPIFGGPCQTQIPIYPYASNTLPVGTSVIVWLDTDPTGNVTQANFEVAGNGPTFSVPIPASFQVPVQSFQFVAVGLDGGANATFNPGTAATISYEVDYGQTSASAALILHALEQSIPVLPEKRLTRVMGP